VTPDLAASFGLKSAIGALVVAVEKGSPADKAGFMPGDVILKVEARPVERSIDLPQLIAATVPGTTMKFEVWRHGATKELVATIGELASEQTPTQAREEKTQTNRLGLALRELTPAQRAELGTGNGLLVRSVRGAALSAGIQQGDVIVAINDTKVDRMATFEKVLAGVAPGSTVALLVLRDGNLVYVPVRVPG
jgi:serine protease Do